MRLWRTIFAVAFATLWVAAGSHCLLESLLDLDFLSCCSHQGVEKTPAHHAKECGDDGCEAVELGFYKRAESQPAPVIPLLALVIWLVPMPDDCLAGFEDSLAAVPPSPPDLPGTWQFLQRTALPPRAPSFVS